MGLENFEVTQQRRSIMELKKLAVGFICDGISKDKFIAADEEERVQFEQFYNELEEEFFAPNNEQKNDGPKMAA